MTLAVPAEAEAVFGSATHLAARFAELLATEGIARGLIGPREVPRLWDRHLSNCAVVTELLPDGAHVVDVGSGAGLPGIPLAIRRPDLAVTLVEPKQRRVEFLVELVDLLGLGDRVRVVRGRAEDEDVRERVGRTQWVTARAVAPLDRLVGWCLPLLRPGGTLLALKGASASDEVAAYMQAVSRSGADHVEIVSCGTGVVEEPTTVVAIRRGSGRAERGRR
jgi:16S rRNA (guanine527-N7)-methyltransferase